MDLRTSYLGLQLKNPIMPSAGPISKELDSIKKLEDAGAAAITLYSLFEEQIEHEELELDHYTSVTSHTNAEAETYFPYDIEFKAGPEQYLHHIQKAKESVQIPIIASLNGRNLGGWINYAKKIEQAGADALELNVYRMATDPNVTSTELENNYLDIVKEVKAAVNIPIAVKLSPFFTSISNIAKRLDDAGADSIVLFNRFYQPDIDLTTLEVTPNVLLSTPYDMRLPLRWIAVLYNKIKADLAATSGIYDELDVIKLIMAGANVTCMMSSILKFGASHITETLKKMEYWMEVNEYSSVEQMKGSMSHVNVPDPAAFERSQYMKVLHSYK